MSWPTVKMSTIAESIQPGPFGSQLHSSDYSSEGTPIIMPKDMIDSRISHVGLAFVSENHVQRLSRHQVHLGDLIVARKGDVRKCVYISENEEGWMTGSDCLKVSLNPSLCNSRFIYYQLRSPFIGKWLETISIGATMPSLNSGLLGSIELFLPPMDTQKKIAQILSSYDDLIETNQRQIKLLEEAAQRLYKEWFVDLRYPGHENVPVVDGVPEGWKRCTLDDVIEFNPRVVLSKDRIKQCVPMAALSTQSMVLDSFQFTETTSNSGSKFQNSDTLLARITPCLENGKTGFAAGLFSEEGAVGSTEFIVMRSKKLNPYMVYLLARTESFRKTAINSMTGSDGRQRAQPDKIRVYPYILPSATVIVDFETIAKPIFDEVQILNKQNEKLIDARDRLLPKLMSGEIAV